MEIALILFLILLNGVFALSEMAVVSSRSARLQRLVDEGRPGAATALRLHGEPSRFLSTIQVGITSVGILSGALGESALAAPIAAWLLEFPATAPYARGLSLGLTVVIITYLAVVLGELVPKRLALRAPEVLASIMGRPMDVLAKVARPLVWVLTASGDVMLRILRADRGDAPPVTDEEIKVLMEQGAEAGVFHESEQAIVSNVLQLDERPVEAIMTPRTDLYDVDLADEPGEIRRRIAESPHSRIVVTDGDEDNVIGILHRGDLLAPALAGEPLDVRAAMRPALFVPRTIPVTSLLEALRRNRTQHALPIDEYGSVEGIVTLNDVLTAIVGDVPEETDLDEELVRRDDGSFLLGGDLGIDRVKDALDLDDDLPGEDDNAFHTLGGFVMHRLGRVPKVADRFEWQGWRFEVVDMDQRRVDKVLASPGRRPAAPPR